MTPKLFRELAILPALSLLSPKYSSRDAVAMLLAVALQESGLSARRQHDGGPARSYFQGEITGGMILVLQHAATKDDAQRVCRLLDIDTTPKSVWTAIEYHDVLACALGRLLLWTHPGALPREGERERAWQYYESLWRPGKPRPESWPGCYLRAWGECA